MQPTRSSSWKSDTLPSAVWTSLQPLTETNLPSSGVVSAFGHRIRFGNGDDVLCATSGLWNVNLGYGNPAIAEAVHGALLECSYSTLFRQWNAHAEEAAAALLDAAGEDLFSRVIYSTSGSAANDLVMKLVRQTQILRQFPEKQLIVALRGSYHGLTYGSFSLTGEDLGQRVYGVDQRLIRHVGCESGDELSELMALQGNRIAAVVVEPVLGTGAYPVPPDFLDELFRFREKYGFIIVADEVATGFGRTGPMFASTRWSQGPDVLITSKGLTNGSCAAAAVLTSADIAQLFVASGSVFTHGETQAGTPATAAAILATLSEFMRLDALDNGVKVARQLDSALNALTSSTRSVTAYRGQGCFRALDVIGAEGAPITGKETSSLLQSIRRAGASVYPGPGGIQLIPSLTYSEVEVRQLFESIAGGLSEFATVGVSHD
ncbi:daptide-type RiPP biosynthesis aminotransferase [Arthrobacter methylotrophus]|uniref:Daptide-type RiPP biosynthesis aminotransferase n=1 Tax=Arthrobacter methylotrophus TaxID=121291 RepID=A0ABV5UT56_9MICC